MAVSVLFLFVVTLLLGVVSADLGNSWLGNPGCDHEALVGCFVALGYLTEKRAIADKATQGPIKEDSSSQQEDGFNMEEWCSAIENIPKCVTENLKGCSRGTKKQYTSFLKQSMGGYQQSVSMFCQKGCSPGKVQQCMELLHFPSDVGMTMNSICSIIKEVPKVQECTEEAISGCSSKIKQQYMQSISAVADGFKPYANQCAVDNGENGNRCDYEKVTSCLEPLMNSEPTNDICQMVDAVLTTIPECLENAIAGCPENVKQSYKQQISSIAEQYATYASMCGQGDTEGVPTCNYTQASACMEVVAYADPTSDVCKVKEDYSSALDCMKSALSGCPDHGNAEGPQSVFGQVENVLVELQHNCTAQEERTLMKMVLKRLLN